MDPESPRVGSRQRSCDLRAWYNWWFTARRASMRFGVSTHLYHDRRSSGTTWRRSRLTASRRSSSSPRGVTSTITTRRRSTRLAQWLAETGLTLNSVHAPITDRFASGRPVGADVLERRERPASGARRRSARPERRCRSRERIPFDVLVVHLGTPTSQRGAGRQSSRRRRSAASRRSAALAEPLGVRVAVEVIPNELSDAAVAGRRCSSAISTSRHAGICLDFGHAHLMGDVVDAIETASEHIIATHVHDNRGQRRRSPRAVAGHDRLERGADRRCRRSATTARI